MNLRGTIRDTTKATTKGYGMLLFKPVCCCRRCNRESAFRTNFRKDFDIWRIAVKPQNAADTVLPWN